MADMGFEHKAGEKTKSLLTSQVLIQAGRPAAKNQSSCVLFGDNFPAGRGEGQTDSFD